MKSGLTLLLTSSFFKHLLYLMYKEMLRGNGREWMRKTYPNA